jgi:UDP-GlcNAc:undecaprenyl-phosphate/decaprenyl-phosphate GlcNAc-1-phosphate transferase
MGAELAAFTLAGITSAAVTPIAIRVANRTGFYDYPREYRKHAKPTPFLGGAAVLVAFLAATALLGNIGGSMLVLLACAVGLWLLGTLDDRFSVAPRWRVLAAACAAIALSAAQLGWETSGGWGVDVALTVFWIVGLVNAFNLMDNLDGACSTVAATSAAGVGILAIVSGHAAIAVLAFALAGACAGFLPWNLAGPARIFLGDGGSMTLGFLVAALAMAAGRHLNLHDGNVLAVALVVGVPILDTTLVIVSRRRRRVSVLTGGRDHLTHRILLALPSPRGVAAALCGVQATLCGLAIAGEEFGIVAVVALAFGAVLLGSLAVLVLDLDRWRPAGIAFGPVPVSAPVASAASISFKSG